VVPEPRQTPGGSAQAEFERRVQRRQDRVRRDHPRLGGLLLALTNDPVSTRVWAQGAAGERAVASALDDLGGSHLELLHDRVMRDPSGRLTKANLDHLAVAATGVWVIDAKTHRGSLEVRRSGGLFGPRVEQLVIAGRDQTKLVHGLNKQMAAVRRQLDVVGADVPVHGALCFVGTELPWFGSSSIVGVPLVGRRGLSKLLRAEGPLPLEERQAIRQYLSQRFPAAAVPGGR
jgi:hypothetical protein